MFGGFDDFDGFDSVSEECGVFGIYTKENSDVTRYAYTALYALQHRGQESCGIAVNDRGIINYKRGMGLVNEVFNKDSLDKLNHGKIAIGHVRYTTTGLNSHHNTLPIVVKHIKGPMALAYNGNLINSQELRESYENKGAIFHSTNGAEVIAYAVTEQRLVCGSIEESLEKAMYKIKGAYSLVIMSPKKLIIARDPNGIRPLCLGILPDEAGYVAVSESCALNAVGAKFLRDVLPGEIIVISDKGISSIKTHCGNKGSLCVFEYIYFARPDSVIEGVSVHEARIRAGEFLAKEHPVVADVVIGVPDSGIDAALGYSKRSGIPYDIGLVKNRYVGRTFIQPAQETRESTVKIKLSAMGSVVRGKRVIVIDDSIVRGTTMKIIIKIIREAGAKEVHIRLSSPPFKNPCFFGTDIDNRDFLIANQKTPEEIRGEIGADSLGYLSIENVEKVAAGAKCGFCSGCFSGRYPMEVPSEIPKDKFDLKLS
ncbi:MAG: amidophosphoribosyltransferase [Oscillospiraceae bacterium]|jgi:amidophosphoribosyltransferase|nr:amidophosphoribosyltransferase [Oscillospiraceae bacterium]